MKIPMLRSEVVDKSFRASSANPDVTNQQVKLRWLGVGKAEFLDPRASMFIELLKLRTFAHRSPITEGGRTWMNARHYLTETLQK